VGVALRSDSIAANPLLVVPERPVDPPWTAIVTDS
jgi:hypothetical protein